MSQTMSRGSLIDCELGHYRVVEKIGQGAMGEVFRARDEHLEHDVALKVLPPGTDDHARHIFRKEAHALSKLNHPNIVTVIDFDRQGDVDFLVMEYVPGLALDEKLRRGPLPENEVVRLGIQLAEGLAAAHEQGVIHRDLKPGNLRLTDNGRLKILDFGLAQSVFSLNPLATTESFAGDAQFAGTLPYMAPEQLRGEQLDAGADIYSAGVVLYELITGHPPFIEQLSPRLIDAILHREALPPSQLRHGISKHLEEIILRCLRKRREDRYSSAKDLLADLLPLAPSATSARLAPGSERKRSRHRLYILIALVMLTVVAVAVGWRRRIEPADGLANSGRPAIQSLAVLPLANLSGDASQEYLADGMTESLITDLGQIHTFRRVISFTSVMNFKDKRQPLPEIARQLQVDAIIEGSVVRADKTVQVNVRLLNAGDTQLWAHTYQREFRDLLTLQRELALAIASEVKASLSAGERARLSPTRPVETAAQEVYLKANYLSTGTAEQRSKARQTFEQAIQLDPNYAPAYAGLADSYWNDVDLPPRESMPKARGYALKAISLDETLARAHTALAAVRFYSDWDWPAAEREFQRALELNPNDAEAHRMFSVFLSAMGRAEEAWAQMQVAQELNPLSFDDRSAAGWIQYCARRYDQAMEQCQRALELAPNYDSAHACLAYSYLGKGQYPQAIEESNKAWTLSGRDTVHTVLLGRTYAQGGSKLQARKILAQLLKRSRQTYVPPYFIATLYTALGDKETALVWLDKAYNDRDLYMAWMKVDPAVDPLRSEERFKQLSSRMGL